MHNRNNKYYQTLFLILFFLLIAYSLPLNVTIRFVSKTGLSIPPYTTWETAADSIQKCINICVFSDTIYVANGVYEELVVMIPGLSLIGAGTDSCIIDTRIFTASGLHSVEMADSCLVKGFYIRTTNDFNYGYGIYPMGQNGIITKNKFSNANHGVWIFESDMEVYDNYFFNVRFGIGLANSNSIVRKNIISMNVEGVDGIDVQAFSSSYAPIIDSNYIDNVYDTGIFKLLSSSPTIKNNVIRVKYSTGIRLAQGGTAKVYNNLIINSGYIGIDYFANSYVLINNNYVIGKPESDGIKVWSNSLVKNNVVTNTGRGISKYDSQNPII